MTEIYIPMPSKSNITLYIEQEFDGFIVGLKEFSSNFNYLYSIDEIKEITSLINKYNKKIFVSFDRLYFNDEIEKVKECILKLNDLNITGICYTDIGVLNILKEINFDKEIIWNSNHLGTNSKTINFLGKRGVDYALLSTEITIDEIIKIKKNSNVKIGAFMYGYLNMATSSRKLLTNYFNYTNKGKNKDKYVMKDKASKNEYILVEKKNTDFYTGSILNGIKYFPELIKNNIDFIILDDYLILEKSFYNVIEAFSSLRKAYNDKEFVLNLEKVVDYNSPTDTFSGFLEKKTVFKVEDYGKN